MNDYSRLLRTLAEDLVPRRPRVGALLGRIIATSLHGSPHTVTVQLDSGTIMRLTTWTGAFDTWFRTVVDPVGRKVFIQTTPDGQPYIDDVLIGA